MEMSKQAPSSIFKEAYWNCSPMQKSAITLNFMYDTLLLVASYKLTVKSHYVL